MDLGLSMVHIMGFEVKELVCGIKFAFRAREVRDPINDTLINFILRFNMYGNGIPEK